MAVRTSIAKHVRCGSWHSRAMLELRAALLNSMLAQRRFMPPTRTCVAATDSVLIFDQHPMTSGHSGTTGLSEFPTLARFLRRSSLIPSTTTLSPMPSSLTRWPVAGQLLTSAQSMGRRCLAYDIEPVRPEIAAHDIRQGFPAEAAHAT